jgi:hypothetical protein
MGVANAASGGLGQYMNYSQNQTTNSLLQQALGARGLGGGGGAFQADPNAYAFGSQSWD